MFESVLSKIWSGINILPVQAELKFQVLSRLLSAAAECSVRIGMLLSSYLIQKCRSGGTESLSRCRLATKLGCTARWKRLQKKVLKFPW